ncbi:nicotinamidase/pyrazinamidase [Thermosulfidibacter takaii ABI70S6]|uniref:nicotinamidase n=1 Tax=Thermosulfidibacter takaii (strain DSM 17441 / JCM 13301 / NBRC 103674 / ABI70S6) TaxID=1298851 RepID=A0A0S3QT26_THET7|nr:nicotinamidase [Thermosulfidibacter takaii]BAT71490.1 nicotinamidase/pyrazinamidase [Thermosulfidibacter takaii ABI70S6]
MASAEIMITSRDALIVVDVQNDFIDGSLPVPNAESIIPNVNKYIALFSSKGNPLFFTRDWHPENHISFKENGGVWPKHCVQHTEGAQFHPAVKIPEDNVFIISKGTDPAFDAYSGFQGTILDQLLKERGIKRLFICGLATDYCVYNTALGGLNLGYQVFVLLDAIKGVNINPDDSEKALERLYQLGAVGLVI